MKTKVGMDLGGEKWGRMGKGRPLWDCFGFRGNIGKSMIYAECASAVCKGRGRGGLPPPRRPPPCHKWIAVRRVRSGEEGVD